MWEGFIQREPFRELKWCDQEVQVLHSGMTSLTQVCVSVACGELRQGLWSAAPCSVGISQMEHLRAQKYQ